ncbi:hypothetical protein GPALN_011221 [Globodera pallida]|nr:hypothetical protein GPALN_011221 [Globodera pallida]
MDEAVDVIGRRWGGGGDEALLLLLPDRPIASIVGGHGRTSGQLCPQANAGTFHFIFSQNKRHIRREQSAKPSLNTAAFVGLRPIKRFFRLRPTNECHKTPKAAWGRKGLCLYAILLPQTIDLSGRTNNSPIQN